MLSHFCWVRLFVTSWTVAYQVLLSMGFSRQVYWRGLPCPPPGDLPDLGTAQISLPLLHCRQILCPLSHLGSPPRSIDFIFHFLLIFIRNCIKFLFYWNIVDLQHCVSFCCPVIQWYIYIHTLFFIFFYIIVCHRMLNIGPCAVQRALFFIQPIYNSWHLLILNSQFFPLHPTSLLAHTYRNKESILWSL